MEYELRSSPKKLPFSTEHFLAVLASLLILMWVFTVAGKATALPKFRVSMGQQPLPIWMKEILIYALLPIEAGAAILLSFPRTRLTGFILSAVLMSTFTIYVAWMLAFHQDLPCACGGPIPGWGWNAHLAFNVCFTVISFCGLSLLYKPTKGRGV